MDCLVASWIVYDGVELTPAIASIDECDKQSNGNDVQDGPKVAPETRVVIGLRLLQVRYLDACQF